MSRDERKYVRVYYDLIREFPGVYSNAAALGTWLRLLMVADAMYPGLPELPRSVRPRDLRTLTEAGLVTVTGPTFHIRGLDAERIRRSASGRNAAAVRWQSGRNADPMPRQDETRRDKTSSTAPDPWDDPEGPLLTWLARAGCLVTPGYHRHLVTAVEVHGADAILAAFERLAKAGMKRGDVKGYIFGAIDALNAAGRPDPKVIAAAEAEERSRLRTQRALAATRAKLDAYTRTPEEVA